MADIAETKRLLKVKQVTASLEQMSLRRQLAKDQLEAKLRTLAEQETKLKASLTKLTEQASGE